MTPHEFASAGWIDAYEDVVREEMAGVDTGGESIRIAREFTDAPAAVCDPGQTSVGWCLEVRDGDVQVHRGPSREGDAITVSDYDAIAPAARLVIGDDDTARARAGEIVGSAMAAGKLSQSGEDTLPAEVRRRLSLIHDRMARLTR